MKNALRYLVAPALLLFGYSILHSQQSTQTQRFPQFDNKAVKVWRTVVMPNAPLAMHRHEHPRVIIPLNGGTMKIVEKDGTTEGHVWETGKAYWLTSSSAGTVHADLNTGDKPIEVMVVELLNEK